MLHPQQPRQLKAQIRSHMKHVMTLSQLHAKQMRMQMVNLHLNVPVPLTRESLAPTHYQTYPSLGHTEARALRKTMRC